jgi:hypothetical protein
VQEFLKSIGEANVMRIKTDMQSQLNAFGEQAKGFAQAYAKLASDTGEKRR